jgi:hypothetical protein
MMTEQLPTPERIRSYLCNHGWHEARQLPPAGAMYSLTGQSLTVFAPELEAAIDYPLRVADVVATLSSLEGRPEAAIRADLLGGISSQPVSKSATQPADSVSAADTTIRKGA